MRLYQAPLWGALVAVTVTATEVSPDTLPKDTFHAARSGDMFGLRKLRQLNFKQHNPQAVDGWEKTALHYAAEYGHNDIARNLMSSSAEVNAQDYRRRTPLMLAAIRGNINVLKSLLDNCDAADSCDNSAQDESGKNALHHAAEMGHHYIVAKLANHIGVDSTTEEGETAMMLAAQRGHYQCVDALVKAGASKSATDSAGLTAAIHAASYGHDDVFKYINQPDGFSAAAAIAAIDNKGRSVLHHVILSGHTAFLKSLFNGNNNFKNSDQADLDNLLTKTDSKGETAMHYAARAGNKEACQILHSESADLLTMTDSTNQQPLHVVTRLPHTGYAEILEFNQPRSPAHFQTLIWIVTEMKKGDHSLNDNDVNGFTPLLRAVEYGDLRMVKYLMSQVDATNGLGYQMSDGESAFHIAIRQNRLNTLSQILHAARKANVNFDNMENSDGNNPLMFSIKDGNYGAMDLCLRYGSDVHRKDSGGRSAIIWAVIGQKYDIAENLFHHKANSYDKDGERKVSVLHFAAGSGDNEMVNLVVSWMKKQGLQREKWDVTSISGKDKSGSTALETAAYLNKADVVENLMARTIKLIKGWEDFQTANDLRGNQFREACGEGSALHDEARHRMNKACRLADKAGATDAFNMLSACCPQQVATQEEADTWADENDAEAWESFTETETDQHADDTGFEDFGWGDEATNEGFGSEDGFFKK